MRKRGHFEVARADQKLSSIVPGPGFGHAFEITRKEKKSAGPEIPAKWRIQVSLSRETGQYDAHHVE